MLLSEILVQRLPSQKSGLIRMLLRSTCYEMNSRTDRIGICLGQSDSIRTTCRRACASQLASIDLLHELAN